MIKYLAAVLSIASLATIAAPNAPASAANFSPAQTAPSLHLPPLTQGVIDCRTTGCATGYVCRRTTGTRYQCLPPGF
jgi:hypothetical protein